MTGWARLDRFLHTDPRDVGCAGAMDLLDAYVDLAVTDPEAAARRSPGVAAAHLRACGPCCRTGAGCCAATQPRGDAVAVPVVVMRPTATSRRAGGGSTAFRRGGDTAAGRGAG